MTTTSVTHIEQLAQDTYEFVLPRLADHIAPVFKFLQTLNLDRATYMKIENVFSDAISEAEESAFITGFTMSRALENIPAFAPSGD